MDRDRDVVIVVVIIIIIIIIIICYTFSDDRSPDVFRKVLESSTEMKAVLTANSKPNCLVIDEIDGAPVVSGSDTLSNTLT